MDRISGSEFIFSLARRARAGARVGLAVALALLAAVAALLMLRAGPVADLEAVPAQAADRSPGLAVSDALAPNGVFEVAVLVDGAWQEVGSLGYRQFPSEQQLDLAGLGLAGEVQVRVAYSGDTAAHVDCAQLDGRPPTGIAGAVEGAALALQKLASPDDDLIDARGRTLILTFAPGGTFSLLARIEPERISDVPFRFPPENLYQTMGPSSDFYAYAWDSARGVLIIDGELEGEGLEEPFFEEATRPGTGHPAGFTYGWVRNDDRALYVAIDFTSDNTTDGDKDYAEVYVKTPSGWRAFKVSVPEQRWGAPGFAYTDRAAYQHKVYEFAIPLAELDLAPRDGDVLELAFAAYGTSGPPPPPLPGPLDPSFGGDGVVTTTIVAYDYGRDLVLQPNGKIVVVGYVNEGGDYRVTLARYERDGTLDAGFGTAGIVTTAIGNDAYGYAIDRQPDGKLVVAGTSHNGSNYDIVLARYTAMGTLDAGFGSGGVVTTTIGTNHDRGRDVLVLPSGNILVVGYTQGTTTDFVLVRYTALGALDTSFGVAGTGIVTRAIGPDTDRAYAVARQSDGKLVVGGESWDGSDYGFALACYNPGGTPYLGFGTGGVVTATLGSDNSRVQAVDLYPDGKIVAAGYSHVGSDDYDFALARYTVTGTLDLSFGAGGIVKTDSGSGSDDRFYAVDIQSDGKIVGAGASGDGRLALARYRPNGSLDTTFGTGGQANVDIGFYSDYAYGMRIQPDGRIVTAGHAQGSGYGDFALVRYGRDLVLQKTAAVTTATLARPITYTLRFTNTAAPVAGAMVIDDMPFTLGEVQVISSGAPITLVATSPEYRWQVGPLPYGASGVITISGLLAGAQPSQTVTNTAVITTTGWESNFGNNVRAVGVWVTGHTSYLPLVLRN